MRRNLRRFEPGGVILRDGGRVRNLYVIKSGRVRLSGHSSFSTPRFAKRRRAPDGSNLATAASTCNRAGVLRTMMKPQVEGIPPLRRAGVQWPAGATRSGSGLVVDLVVDVGDQTKPLPSHSATWASQNCPGSSVAHHLASTVSYART